jgi:hypothetical protein
LDKRSSRGGTGHDSRAVARSHDVRECHGCLHAAEGDPLAIEFITYSEYGEPLELTHQLIGEMLEAILRSNPNEVFLIEGHTDAVGSAGYNLDLSRQRAQSVSNYLATQQVFVTRFAIMGYGEDQPIASNDTDDGRQQNRRVEVAIYANDKLKKAAEERAQG